MSLKKLVICDIDGTLLDSPSQKLPSDRLIRAIQDLKDQAYITCATGRAASWAMPVLKSAGFTAPCIVGGGTFILDQSDQSILYQQRLPKVQLENIKDVLRAYPNSRVIFNDYTEDEYLNGGWPLQKLLDTQECYIMEVIELDHKTADELIVKFQALINVTSVKMNSLKRGMVDVHVIHEEATKEHAIIWLQNHLGISKADTIGIGDGYNDIHIFNAVGTKIAVSNANPELKQIADKVIGDVKDDAVAQFLEGLKR